jgi:hypothetical protein
MHNDVDEGMIHQLCGDHSHPGCIRSAAQSGGFVPHMTLWYIGQVSQEQVNGIVLSAKSCDTAAQVLPTLSSEGGSVRLAQVCERFIVLQFHSNDDGKLKHELTRLYESLVACGVFDAAHPPRINPHTQLLPPHVTLFEHADKQSCQEHFDKLQQDGVAQRVSNNFQALHFGEMYLAIRGTNAQVIQRVDLV